MRDRQGKLEIGYPVMNVSEWTRSAPLVSIQVPKERKIAKREKGSTVGTLMVDGNGKEEIMWRNGKEENIRRNGNEQQKETMHQSAIASPSVVPSDSSIGKGVDITEDKERVGIVATEKESVSMKEEEKESMNIKEEEKESVNTKDEKKKTKASLKSRLKGNVLFRFK